MSAKRPRLSKFCTEFLMFALHIRRTQNPGHPGTLRESVKLALQKLENTCKQAGVGFQDFQQAKFALVAFLDESVSIPAWPYNDAWKRNPLQFELYGRYDAGEQFFERIAFLRQDVRANLEALEVFYLCLTLGFRGKYEIVGRDQLAALQDQLYRDLQPFVQGASAQLAPSGYPRAKVMAEARREIPVWVIFAIAGSIMILFYIIMSFLISSAAANVMSGVQ
ncbi:MAG: type IVB secretion system protein IcmH/DotU [Bacteroidetes Order II. Incertae sedis bacterium]|nr:type IVB secretion system protein IcmH/DotU [Bacteroidetes Order II. bacterium]